MDNDLLIVAGVLLAGFSIPSILNAVSERRTPRFSLVAVAVAAGLLVYSVIRSGGEFNLPNALKAIEGVPNAFVSVIGRYIL
jgi:hypothetical protein